MAKISISEISLRYNANNPFYVKSFVEDYIKLRYAELIGEGGLSKEAAIEELEGKITLAEDFIVQVIERGLADSRAHRFQFSFRVDENLIEEMLPERLQKRVERKRERHEMAGDKLVPQGWLVSSDLYNYRLNGARITPEALKFMRQNIIAEMVETGLDEEQAVELAEKEYVVFAKNLKGLPVWCLNPQRYVHELGLNLTELPDKRYPFLPDADLIKTIDDRVAGGARLANDEWRPTFRLAWKYSGHYVEIADEWTKLATVSSSNPEKCGWHDARRLMENEEFWQDRQAVMVDPKTGHECLHFHDSLVKDLEDYKLLRLARSEKVPVLEH